MLPDSDNADRIAEILKVDDTRYMKSELAEYFRRMVDESPYSFGLDEYPVLEKHEAEVFRRVGPNTKQRDIAEETGLSELVVSGIIRDLEDDNLVDHTGSGRGKKNFYGPKAFPYLATLSMAEEEEGLDDIFDRYSEPEEVSEDDTPDRNGDKEPQEIMDEALMAAGIDDGQITVYEQKPRGVIEATEVDEDFTEVVENSAKSVEKGDYEGRNPI